MNDLEDRDSLTFLILITVLSILYILKLNIEQAVQELETYTAVGGFF